MGHQSDSGNEVERSFNMRDHRPPRLPQALIRLVIRGEQQACVLGDLEEMFASVTSKIGGKRAVRWYWKEAIVTTAYVILRGIETHRVTALTLAIGALCGVILIDLTLVSTRGALGFFVYAGLMLAMAVFLPVMSVQSFWQRFSLTLTAFMTATLLLYWFIIGVMAPEARALPLWGHAWRIGFALALGSLAATIVAAFSSRKSSPFLVFPFVPVIASAYLVLMRPSQEVRAMFRVILPFALIVNWRRDGWCWAFAGLDVLLWAGIGWALLQWWRKTPHRMAPIASG